ncbi:glycosyltransferase family 4 protein [Clostridium butyricum]|uniref:glycosyltransferase family 4 protein n=1 Tax=Clostridium butyricum TaxID=1492 RepID=UPI00374E3547
MINVLMIGSDLSVKGGMTTVVKSFLNNNFEDVNITYVPTHIENVGKMYKILFFIKSLIIIVKNLIINDVNIVHIHLSERGSFFRKLIVVLICKVFGKKVIIHLHGADFKEFYNNNKYLQRVIKKMFLIADSVIVLGTSWNDFIKGIDQSINTIIIRNSVEIREEKVNYDGININILFLAVIIKRKGIFDFVKVASNIINDNELKKYNLKFIVAGSGKDEKEVKKYIKDGNLQSYFRLEGWVSGEKKIEIIKKCQLFVLPSYNEGLPLSILEAMSYGLPVISTTVGSIDEVVIDNLNGYTVKPGDINKIQEKIKMCIKDSELWKTLSTNSKKIIQNEYGISVYLKKIEELYSSLL